MTRRGGVSGAVRAALHLGGVVAVAACSPVIDAPARDPLEVADGAPSPTSAERRAARLLSLTNNSSLDNKKTPYDRDVACLAAIGFLEGRMAEMIAISQEQRRALAQARGLYRRKALAEADGKDARAVDADRDVLQRDAEDDPAQSAKTAVACLRRLV